MGGRKGKRRMGEAADLRRIFGAGAHFGDHVDGPRRRNQVNYAEEDPQSSRRSRVEQGAATQVRIPTPPQTTPHPPSPSPFHASHPPCIICSLKYVCVLDPQVDKESRQKNRGGMSTQSVAKVRHVCLPTPSQTTHPPPPLSCKPPSMHPLSINPDSFDPYSGGRGIAP